MNTYYFDVVPVDLDGHADAVLSGTNVCLEKTLSHEQAKLTINKLISYHLLRCRNEKVTKICIHHRRKRSYTILVEVESYRH